MPMLVPTLFSVLFFVALLGLLHVRVHTLLAYFQQEEYEPGRFLAAVGRMRLYDVISSLVVLVAFALAGMLGRFRELALLVSAAAFVLVALRERRFRFKKPLALTERVGRLRALALGIAFVLALAVFWWAPLAIIVLQLVPLVIIAANAALQPAQERINARYIAEAREKLAAFEGVKIGVTGSFGKTSVKHILAQALALDGNVFFSRGSINTVLGLTRHIRQRLQPGHKYLIAEMGAYQIGSIERLAEFVRPEIGIITAVGEAHLERFGSIENVAQGKSELAKFVCEHGRLVVTTEAVLKWRPFNELFTRYKQKFMVIGTSEAADVRILESRLEKEARLIRLDVEGRRLELSVPLLASYNAGNIALVVGVVARIAPEILDSLPALFAKLEQTPHRLEKKEKVSAPLLLDDAYNSNETGFQEAVEMLHALATGRGGKAVLITPGIVELGERHEEVHRRLGELSGRLLDAVYVVNPERIPSFVEGARAGGRAMVETVPRFGDAQRAADRQFRDTRDVVLYENDLPDVLEETRLL
ncbi:MAG TPA: Mur ligase family protein [Devosia sp.]|nr:Mur ligase family protein [Devosia sp.]